MNPKATLTLVAVLALAGSLLLLTSQGNRSSQNDEKPSTDERITLLDAGLLGTKLTHITFDGGLDFPLELERIAGQWQVTSPHGFPARAPAVDNVLTILSELKGEPTKQHFGPDPDQGGIILRTNGESVSLLIGQRLGSGKAGIALIAGDEIRQFIVDDALHELYEQVFEPSGRYAYFAKTIRPLLMPEFKRVEIDTIDSKSVLQQADGRWMIGEGENAERALESQIGEYPGVADYFKLIEAIKIDAFVQYGITNDLANFGLNRPIATVHFMPLDTDPGKANSGMTLRVGVPADLADQTRYVSYGRSDDPYPVVFTTQSQIAIAFGQDAKRFRDPRITTLSRRLIKTIRIAQPDRRDVMVHLDSGRSEHLAAADAGLGNYPVDIKPQGSTLLTRILDAHASDFLEADQNQLNLLGTLSFVATLGKETESVQVYQDIDPALRDSSVLVRRGNEAILLRFERSMFDQLLRLPEQLNNN